MQKRKVWLRKGVWGEGLRPLTCLGMMVHTPTACSLAVTLFPRTMVSVLVPRLQNLGTEQVWVMSGPPSSLLGTMLWMPVSSSAS